MSDEPVLASPLLNSHEVAVLLKVSESTLSRWRADEKGGHRSSNSVASPGIGSTQSKPGWRL